jgi:hypothetical protein
MIVGPASVSPTMVVDLIEAMDQCTVMETICCRCGLLLDDEERSMKVRLTSTVSLAI